MTEHTRYESKYYRPTDTPEDRTQEARTLVLPLVKSDTSYGNSYPRWVTPEYVELRGDFKHNRHSPFGVNLFLHPDDFIDWHGGNKGQAKSMPPGVEQGTVRGYLSAQPTVISSSYGPGDYKIHLDVREGDVLITYLGNYTIRDNWALHDPYLVLVPTDPKTGAFVG